MIKHLLFVTVTLFCTIEIFAQAGPTNANSYRNFIRTNGFSYGHDHNGVGEANRPVFLIEGVRATDPVTPNCLFDTLTGAGADVLTVYNAGGMPPFDNFNQGTIKEVVNTTTSTTIMDVTMMAWDHECGDEFLYDPSCDFNKEAACTKINTMEGSMGLYDEQWYTINDTARIRMQKAWKYTRGENFAAIDGARGPLTFGTIGPNQYRVHENGNRIAPEGAPSYMGYQNWWFDGLILDRDQLTPSPDVTYSFETTEDSYIIISLDFPETNFDTRLYVFRKSSDNGGRGTQWGYRNSETNDGIGKTVLSFDFLPADEYFLVIEGESADPAHTGDFKVTIATPETYEPGSITHDATLVPEGCVINTPIITDVAAQTSIGTPEYKWEYKQGTDTGWSEIEGATSETLSGEELGPITDSTFVRRRLSTLGGAIYTNELRFDIEVPDGGNISGRVTGPNGATGVDRVAMIIESLDATSCKPDTVETNSSGSYNTANLIIDATYRVTPMFLDHEFSPTHIDVTINSTEGVEDQNFTDLTALFVEGRVTQTDSLNTTCPFPGVTINTIDRSEQGVSSEDGTYRVSIEPGIFSFEASFSPDSNHTFVPASYDNVTVNADQTGLDYESTTTYTVSGSVLACGGFCYGGVEIRLVDDFGCFDYLLDTDECGNFSATLPARNYQLIVTDTDLGLADGFDAVTIEQFFANQDTIWADLSSADTVMTLVYEQAPIVTLRPHTDSTGIQPVPNCSQDTVLEQLEVTTLVFDIEESFTDGCPLDTGLMVFVDEISGRDTVYVPISDGVVMYDIIPDTPNLFPFEPYQHLEFYAMNLDSQLVSSSQTIRAIVTGTKARNGTFVTVSPDIPLMILRDPPGDQSFAEIIDEESSELSFSLSTLMGGSVSVWSQTKLGAKFEAGALGISTESEVWGTVQNTMEVGASNSTTEELTLSLTNVTSYRTREDEATDFIGEGGDIFIGAALNLLYAQADVLEFDNRPGVCRDTQVVDIIMGTDGLASTYAFSAHEIRNNLIPDIAFLRDNGPADSIWWYQNQIDMWQQTLDRNDFLKSIADTSEFNTNRLAIDGGVTTSASITRSSTFTSEYEFKVNVSSELAVAAGLEVAGAGFSGGVQVNLRAELGLGGGSKSLSSRTTSYTFKDIDDEGGDKYLFNILECPTYGTPVFEEIASETSCPYIPGTLQRDKPLLTIANPIRGDVNPLDPSSREVFTVTITNLSESDETREYWLDVIENSNPNSATISDVTGPARRLFKVLGRTENGGVPGQFSVDIFIEKNPASEVFSYENITFIAYPKCEDISDFVPQTSSTASVSLFFDSPCSDVTMNLPQEGWVVSDDDSNLLTANMSVEDVQFMDSVVVEYSSMNQNSWKTLEKFDPGEVPGFDFEMDVASLADGQYDIRLRLFCDGGEISTMRVSGTIDREAPVVFGIPSPLDDIYDPSANDEISVSFEEDITCVNASLLLTDMETLEVIPATLSCAGNQAMVVPDVLLDLIDPAIYRVTLSGVEDPYGNVREDYNWVFIVGDYVFDPDCSPVAISNNNVDQDAISQSVYYSQQITSDGTVPVASTVDMRAEESIELEPGFTVNTGGVYLAEIAICPND